MKCGPPARKTPGRRATASQWDARICAYRVSYVGKTERKMQTEVQRALCNPSGFTSPGSMFTKPAPSLPNANMILRGITEQRIWMKTLLKKKKKKEDIQQILKGTTEEEISKHSEA